MKATGQSPRYKLMLLTVGLSVGGTEGQVLEIASRLDPNRFDVMVCSLKRSGVIADELQRRGVRVISLEGKGMWDLRVLFGLFQVIRAERPDIIHAFLFWANFVSRLVGKLLQVPVLISSYRGVDSWRGWYQGVLDRLTARWVHAVTCCSEAVRQTVLSKLHGDEQRYVTIHNGVDVEHFTCQHMLKKSELGLQENLPVLGTVCRLVEPQKGLAVLLQAMARLVGSSSSHACQLLIVGEGPAFKQLRELSIQLGIAQWVVFPGERRDISSVLSLMEIFVLPSLSEGFGIAIVEAMAAGRPVVATAVGGIPEIVIHGETGLLVPPGDARSLAVAIHALLADPYKAQLFGSRGRDRVLKKFAIEAVVRKHEELYEALLKSY